MGVPFEEEKFLERGGYKTDFYLPEANLAIEINGKSHFYPYSTRFNNFTNMKLKILLNEGYNV
jgi:very-short-patch-repair endonuclease